MWEMLKTKTVRICIAGILTALGAWIGEQIGTKEMIFAIFTGVSQIFMRAGVAKSGK